MARVKEITAGVFQVGGDGLSRGEDCCVYLVDGGTESALIDTGAGRSASMIMDNILATGVEVSSLKYIVVTHGHIDHIGGLAFLKEKLQAQVIAHQLELPAIEEGLPHLTAASWYGVKYEKVKVDQVLQGDEEKIKVGQLEMVCLHTPGHTVGGISPYVDTGEKRVLFGQDIHGPFNEKWGSDLNQWELSMQKLIELKADILCEGHFGIYSPASTVRKYIEGYLRQYGQGKY
ncbi:MAG: MBL fold metallo-hydrolase [Syntrophomonadaceae bacterium]|nr:MBL fold metallo-hydrolase [Syntrophomonadaceae bacterium]